MDTSVVVVGGGFAGLLTALHLDAAGHGDVLVIDREKSPGGVAQTITRDGYSLETGPSSVTLPDPHLSPILERIEAEMTPAGETASRRYVHTRGDLVPLPASPRALLAPLAPLPAKLRALAEPLIPARPSHDESLDRLMRRRFGRDLGGLAAWLAASGVFAGDPVRLSAASAFPAIASLEEDSGSILRGALARALSRRPGATRPSSHLPANGMSAFADTAASALGDRYRSGTTVTAVRREGPGWRTDGDETLRSSHVVLAIAPGRAASIVDGDLSSLLEESVTAPVVVLGLGAVEEAMPLPEGFGALIGPDEGMLSRGILFESSYAPARAPDGHSLAKVIAGGAANPEVVDWDDDRIVAHLGGELARVLGHDVQSSFREVVRHRPGIPQYELGHSSWLKRIESEVASRPGLHLTGWGYRGVGLAQVAADSSRTATRIAGSSPRH